ncbi:MAG: trypsin-like peptidase domain-containing protein [Rhodovarius sp.]|nr:trypsin-like peptidase domain-containing protein [Rhodovarius sp.]
MSLSPIRCLRGRLVLFAALLWALLPPTPAAGQEAAGFRVVNRTDQPAVALHAVRSPRGAGGDWGESLLAPGRPLQPGQGFRVMPLDPAACRFDLRLVLADGREAQLRERDICAERTITVTEATAPPPAAPAPQAPQALPNRQARQVSTGTGWIVAPERVVTNEHVIAGCNRVLLRTPEGRWLAAQPPARVDAELDLALLTVPGLTGPALTLRAGPPVRRGEGVVAYGFPLAGLLSSDPKLTRGEVNGLAGIGDNRNQIQISAEVQPGNSGGPLLDMQGHVVGVVVSKLNAQRVARVTGDIAQNVNFAIRAEATLAFLQRAGVTPRTASSSGPERSAADVGEIAHRSTLFIRCER